MLLLSIGFILFVLAFFDKAIPLIHKQFIIIFFCSLFVVLGGIRWNTGTDWLPYFYGFMDSGSFYDAVLSPFSFEWGYGILNYIIFNLTASYTIFLIIFTFLKVFFKYKVLVSKEFLPYGLLSLFLYFCYLSGDIISTRQFLATSLTLYSILFIKNRKLYVFLLLVFFASLIHKSAIIFVFAYYIYWLNISRNYLIVIFFVSMLIGVVISSLNISTLYIPIFSDFDVFISYQKKIDMYSELGSEQVYGAIDSTTTNLLGILKKILILLPILLLRKESNIIYARLFNLIIFGAVLYFIFGSIATDFKRLAAYFEVIEIIVYPYYIYSIKNRDIRYVLLFIFCVAFYMRLYSGVYAFWDLLDPFYTIFDFNNYRNTW